MDRIQINIKGSTSQPKIVYNITENLVIILQYTQINKTNNLISCLPDKELTQASDSNRQQFRKNTAYSAKNGLNKRSTRRV